VKRHGPYRGVGYRALVPRRPFRRVFGIVRPDGSIATFDPKTNKTDSLRIRLTSNESQTEETGLTP